MKINKNSQRNISIDILKILSMLMVIVLHATNYGIQSENILTFSYTYYIADIFKAFSLVAVNCFVLISGYFSSTSNLKYSKLIKLWIEVLFYSVGIYLVLCIIPNTNINFNISQLIRHMCPLMTNEYWFFTSYILLMIVSPFLNILIDTMDQIIYKKMLIVLCIVFSVIPSINIFGDSFGTIGLIWFCNLYLVAGYLRRYKIKRRNFGLFYVIISFFIVLLHTISNFFNITAISAFINVVSNQNNSILVFLASISLFLFFANKTVYFNKIRNFITTISSLSFSVYLIHENNSFRDILWNRLVCLNNYTDNAFLFLSMLIIAIIAIFSICIIIDYFRKLIFDFIEKIIRLISIKTGGKL